MPTCCRCSLRGGYGGMVLAGDGLLTIACCVRRDALHSCARACRVRLPRNRCRRSRGVLSRRGAALAGAQAQGAWLGVGPIRPESARGRATRLFAIGNAAVRRIPSSAKASALHPVGVLLCTELCRRSARRSRALRRRRASPACIPQPGGAASRRASASPRCSRTWRCVPAPHAHCCRCCVAGPVFSRSARASAARSAASSIRPR